MPYLDWLKLLLALGPKLAVIWPIVQRMIADFRELVAIVKGTTTEEPGTPSVMEVVTAEAETETQVAALLAGPNAAFDGTLLRGVWSFLQKNPELAGLIWKLLRG